MSMKCPKCKESISYENFDSLHSHPSDLPGLPLFLKSCGNCGYDLNKNEDFRQYWILHDYYKFQLRLERMDPPNSRNHKKEALETLEKLSELSAKLS